KKAADILNLAADEVWSSIAPRLAAYLSALTDKRIVSATTDEKHQWILSNADGRTGPFQALPPQLKDLAYVALRLSLLERFAANGYRIVARKHRCPRGEVDLVAEQGDVLVFVEVRTRATRLFGGPEETIGTAKQQRLVRAARDFLARWRGPPRTARFDVVAVV